MNRYKKSESHTVDLISILITKKMAPEKEIKYKPITPSAYDGSTIQRHNEDPADWRGIIIDPGKHKPYGKTPSFNEIVKRLKKGK